jgi:hypothetical protein
VVDALSIEEQKIKKIEKEFYGNKFLDSLNFPQIY